MSAPAGGAVVAVVAHPDDESLIAGGTLALAAAAGIPTGVVSLTRGELGPGTVAADLGEAREAELQAAARELGVDWAWCMRLPDGELPWVDHAAAAGELAAVLSPHAPVVVLTFGVDGVYWHADHTAAREIAALALRRLAGPTELYEAAWPAGVMPEVVAAAAERDLPTGLWGIEPEAFGTDLAPTLVIDVRAVLDRKLAALRAHRSQIGTDHLFASLPRDLAEQLFSPEQWVGPEHGILKELIGDR